MFAILRTAKLKTAGNCGSLNKHLERTMDVPNADKELSYLNRRQVGSGDLAADVSDRIKSAGIEKPRKNAVLAIEHLMAASPEAFQFKKGSDSKTGKTTLVGPTADIERWKAFEKNCYGWLKDQYGKENIVNFTTHLDEQTPHIHAVVVPIDSKSKLNCRNYLGGREKMRGLQDSFAARHKELGLERGIRGSKTHHLEVKQFYSQIKESKPISLDTTLGFQQVRIQVQAPEKGFAGIGYKQDPAELARQESERISREVNGVNAINQAKASEKLSALSNAARDKFLLQQKNNRLEGQLKVLQKKVEGLEDKNKSAALLLEAITKGQIRAEELKNAKEKLPTQLNQREASFREIMKSTGIAVKEEVELKVEQKKSKGISR
jgi:hypothetical protein